MKKQTFLLMMAFSLLAFNAAAFPNVGSPEDSVVSTAKHYFKQQLKDPESAHFKNIVVFKRSHNGKTFYNVCGEINAKNSYGGYVGYRPFYFSGSNNSGAILNDSNGGLFRGIFKVVCHGEDDAERG